MSIYRHRIFPWLCHRALQDEETARRRREALAGFAGEVLEVGFGTGHNLPCYPEGVTRLVGVEPTPGMPESPSARWPPPGCRWSSTWSGPKRSR